eukprot:scaffold84970_cov69-Phaeocystis_antarctica.AAC.2
MKYAHLVCNVRARPSVGDDRAADIQVAVPGVERRSTRNLGRAPHRPQPPETRATSCGATKATARAGCSASAGTCRRAPARAARCTAASRCGGEAPLGARRHRARRRRRSRPAARGAPARSPRAPRPPVGCAWAASSGRSQSPPPESGPRA